MILDGMSGRVEKNYPLHKLTTWRIGGPGECVYWPETWPDAVTAYQRAQQHGVPVRVFGRGSNLLLPDEGLPGLTVVTTALRSIAWGDCSVQVAAGYSLASLAQESGERGWSGLEFACGIPGTVGGALVMNAGAHGGEIGTCVRAVLVMEPDGSVRLLEHSEISFSYRSSSLRHGCWVLEAKLAFAAGDKEEIAVRIRENLAARRAKQPLEWPNAGSVFRNPPGDSAGRLIAEAGWKGRAVGGARVSEKHANFIINTGRATAEDVLTLMQEIQRDVAGKFGVHLEPEVEIVGRPGA